MSAKKVRAGIIGQGRSGLSIHVHSMGLLPELYEIKAVADLLEERRRHAESTLGITAYADYHEMLKRDDLDLIINATPSHLHVPVTADVLRAGHNVLTEKPLARRAADVDMLMALAAEKGKLFAVYQQSRYAPYFLQVRQVIASGVLGRVVMIKIAFNGFGRRWDWQTLQDMNGGNLLNTGPHPLDQALNLYDGQGLDMPEVFCLMDKTDNSFGDAEDHVKLILHGQGHPTIDLEISSCCAYPLYTYQVYGTRGSLSGNMTHIDWKYYLPEEAPHQELKREPLSGANGRPAYCSEQLLWHEDSWDVPEQESNLFDTMSGKFYRNLHQALTAGTPLEVPPIQVRRQIAVIEECHRQNPLPTL